MIRLWSDYDPFQESCGPFILINVPRLEIITIYDGKKSGEGITSGMFGMYTFQKLDQYQYVKEVK